MSGVIGMKPELMRPFVEGTVEVFDSMLQIRLRENEVEVKNISEGTFDYSAVIGLTGSAAGSFVLSTPRETARRIVGRLLGGAEDVAEQDIVDGLGEVINIAAGQACRKLGQGGIEGIYLSLPAVVIGRHRVVWPSRDLPCLLMRFFDSDLGALSIEVNLQVASGGTSEPPRRIP